MTTSTPTPIWNLPQTRVLPSGMPLPERAEEAIAFTIVHHSGSIPNQVLSTGKEALLTLSVDEAARDVRLSGLDRLFASAMAEYSAVAWTRAPAAMPRPVSREAVMRQVESLRSELHLTAEETASIVGVKPRRYYDLVAGKPFPEGRLHDIAGRTSIIQALAVRDWQATVSLIRGRAHEMLALLDAGRLGDLKTLFSRTKQERTELLDPTVQIEVLGLAAEHRADIDVLIDSPAFDVAAQIVHWIGRTDSIIGERVRAFIELADTYRNLDMDGQIDERFDFLFGLDTEGRLAFRRRAEYFIRGDDFETMRWDDFVAAESERAWNAATTVRLPPVESSVFDYGEDEGTTLSWQPNLERIGAHIRLHDRRRK